MNHFLTVRGIDEGELRSLLAGAEEVKKDPGSVRRALYGRRVGLFFMKPSTRTRVSSEVASIEVGAHPVVLRQDEVGLGSREAPADAARVLERYLDVLALRVFEHSTLVQMKSYSRIPVVNLLSDLEHPCQALADLQTMAEHQELEGTKLAYIGDGNNVCQSLIAAAEISGIEMRVATPHGYEPAVEYQNLLESSGGLLTNDPREAAGGADVIYTDVWASMGQEDQAAQRAELFARYRVSEEIFDMASPSAIFMHCLPAHRGEEVTDAVMDHRRSVVFDQAENRLHSFKALLLHLLG